jgi:general secretion pathway protein L
VILNDLTKLVPDGTWLNTIDYENGQVTISGRGTEIPNVIESLEKSDVFSKVNFASATQRDPNLDVDIFSISASIDKQGAKQ